MKCIPTCEGCVLAGICSMTGQVPASISASTRAAAPRRAVKATYPRDVKTVYVHLSCSHTTSKEAQVFYSVWRDKGSTQLYCEDCHQWTDVEVRETIPADTLWEEPPCIPF
jgi:hypothetical protein